MLLLTVEQLHALTEEVERAGALRCHLRHEDAAQQLLYVQGGRPCVDVLVTVLGEQLRVTPDGEVTRA